MRIALVQMSMTCDMAQNLNKSLHFMEEAKQNGADAICFPEVQLSPFFPQYPGKDASQYAMPIDDPMFLKIREKCRELRLVCFPNVYLEENGKRYDASPVIDTEGNVLGTSKMVHIAQLPNFHEQDYYSPSDTGFKVYDTTVGRIGVVICFDRHLPESIRCCARQGAKLIVIPTANTRAEPMDMFEWEMRVAAMQNGVFISMCNRVGVEDKMDFCGESIIVNSDGDVIAKADDQEQILYADVELAMSVVSQEKRPFLFLMRPEYYTT